MPGCAGGMEVVLLAPTHGVQDILFLCPSPLAAGVGTPVSAAQVSPAVFGLLVCIYMYVVWVLFLFVFFR